MKTFVAEDGSKLFVTADGKTFTVESEAVIHEGKASFNERVGRFIGAYSWNKGRATAASNILTKFLAFEAVYGSSGPAPVFHDNLEVDAG